MVAFALNALTDDACIAVAFRWSATSHAICAPNGIAPNAVENKNVHIGIMADVASAYRMR